MRRLMPGIIAWHFKRKYDGVRPITAIRYAKQGKTVHAWGGPGRPTEKIPGEQWMPYNPGSNLTPAFPGYFSGHSTFSSASATVLQLFTGSDDSHVQGVRLNYAIFASEEVIFFSIGSAGWTKVSF